MTLERRQVDFNWMLSACGVDVELMLSGCQVDVEWMSSGCRVDVEWIWSGCGVDVIWLFIFVTLKSILVGFAFGILSGLLTKYCRFLDKSPIHETFLIIMLGLMAYYVGEAFEASGVTSLIVCSILQAQYAWYNLSP